MDALNRRLVTAASVNCCTSKGRTKSVHGGWWMDAFDRSMYSYGSISRLS